MERAEPPLARTQKLTPTMLALPPPGTLQTYMPQATKIPDLTSTTGLKREQEVGLGPQP